MILSNNPATTEIYTLSLHDALPICGARGFALGRPRRARQVQRRSGADRPPSAGGAVARGRNAGRSARDARAQGDRKSTRLNSSHVEISYAVFCLKKKNKQKR